MGISLERAKGPTNLVIKYKTPKFSKKNNKKIVYLVAIVLVLCGVATFLRTTPKKQPISGLIPPTSVPSPTANPVPYRSGYPEMKGERVLVKDCAQQNPCVLSLVGPDKKAKPFENKYNFTGEQISSRVALSPDGNYVIWLSTEGLLTIQNRASNKEKAIPLSYDARLFNTTTDGVWVKDGTIVKLFYFSGQQRLQFDTSLIASHTPSTYPELTISNIYPNGNILLLARTLGNGGAFETVWQVNSEKTAKKILDIHGLKIDKYLSSDFIDFFHREEAFLIQSKLGTQTKLYGAFYKILPSGKKTLLTREPSYYAILSPDDSSIFFSQTGEYKTDDTTGLLRYDLHTHARDSLIKGDGFDEKTKLWHWYNMRGLSPSGNYLALIDHYKAYTPRIFSLLSGQIITIREPINITSGQWYGDIVGWVVDSNADVNTDLYTIDLPQGWFKSKETSTKALYGKNPEREIRYENDNGDFFEVDTNPLGHGVGSDVTWNFEWNSDKTGIKVVKEFFCTDSNGASCQLGDNRLNIFARATANDSADQMTGNRYIFFAGNERHENTSDLAVYKGILEGIRFK